MFDMQDSPNQTGEKGADMPEGLQQHILTTMQPFVDQIDQLFTAVKSLGDDLAEETARSRVQHDATSLRLNDLDKTLSLHLAEFANASEHHEEVKHVMSRVEEQLDASACNWQRAIQEFYLNAEAVNGCTPSAVHELQRDLRSNAERVACLEAWQQELVPSLDSLREAVSSVQPALNELTQKQLEAFDTRLSVVEKDTQSMKVATEAIADAVEANKLVMETNPLITKNLEPALEDQKRRMADLETPNMEKTGGTEHGLRDGAASLQAMQQSLVKFRQAAQEVTSKLIAPDDHHAEKPDKRSDTLNLATDAMMKQSGKTAVIQHPCRVQQILRSQPCTPARCVTGPGHVVQHSTPTPRRLSGSLHMVQPSSPTPRFLTGLGFSNMDLISKPALTIGEFSRQSSPRIVKVCPRSPSPLKSFRAVSPDMCCKERSEVVHVSSEFAMDGAKTLI